MTHFFSLKVRYLIWFIFLIASVLIFNLGSGKLNSLTGISIPIEVFPIIFSVFLLISSYVLSLRNKYFRSALWVLTILSPSSIILFLFYFMMGQTLGLIVTICSLLIALLIHYYLFWSKRSEKTGLFKRINPSKT